jgi:hypothetical protein
MTRTGLLDELKSVGTSPIVASFYGNEIPKLEGLPGAFLLLAQHHLAISINLSGTAETNKETPKKSGALWEPYAAFSTIKLSG